jgi:2-isopropylmalate synthase
MYLDTMKNKHTVSIYDTTLRDGNQSIGISLSLSDKLRIAEKLDDLGFHYIEGGWPNPTNQLDQQFYRDAKKMHLKAKIAVFGSTRRPNVRCSADPFMKIATACDAPVATIFGKTWDLHVKHVIRTTLEENIAMIGESVAYLKKHFDEVIYDAEHFFDGYKANKEYALKTLEAAMQAGADTIVLCDTNGGMLPDDCAKIFTEVSAFCKTPLGAHMHNDAGCADANSFIAVERGAIQVQGTINGWGERCGNANLCTIVPGLQLKRNMQLIAPDKLAQLAPIARCISEIANVAPNDRLPYIGLSAFSHKGGAHADGVRKIRSSFEHTDPEVVGNQRHFVVSDQAGKSTIIENLSIHRPDVAKDDPRVRTLLDRIKDMESKGYHFEAADGSFELIAESIFSESEEPFIVKGFRVTEEQRENGELFSEATIKIEEKGILEHTAAEGDGPVNALDNAVRKALVKFFPSLAKVKLEDFKVRVLDESSGTGAKVRVLIESSDGTARWGTVGVSTNIIEASWIALIDSLRYKLMMDAKNKKTKTRRR